MNIPPKYQKIFNERICPFCGEKIKWHRNHNSCPKQHISFSVYKDYSYTVMITSKYIYYQYFYNDIYHNFATGTFIHIENENSRLTIDDFIYDFDEPLLPEDLDRFAEEMIAFS